MFLAIFLVIAEDTNAQKNCRPNDNQIAVFEDSNYRGKCRTKTIGTFPSSGAIGLKNDSISSIKIGRNVIAILCRDNSFRGTCQTFSATDPNLGNNRVGNDQVSSIRVIRRDNNPPNSSYRYCANEGQRCNFGGRGTVAYGVNGKFKYRQNVAGGIACNNQTFGDPYRGVQKRCYFIKQNNTPTTSINCRPNSNQIAIFYDANYRGRCVVKNVGRYPSARSFGLPNDSISSIKVGANVRATLCRDNNYRGTCETYSRNDLFLGNNSIGNDQVSSIRVTRKGSTSTNRSVRVRFENNTNYKVSFYRAQGNTDRFSRTLNRNSSYNQATFSNQIWKAKFKGKTIGSYRVRNLSNQTIRVNISAVNAGPIWNDRDAATKCSKLARSRRSLWTGAWRTVVNGQQSVCELMKLN